jgi:hypothetical protein
MTIHDDGKELILVRQLRDRADTRHQHARAVRKGDEVRLIRGAYMARETWDRLDERSRHVLRMVAFARTRRVSPVFSHWSAAACHGLPLLGHLPGALHVVVGRTSGGRSARGVAAHSITVPKLDIVQADELRLTSQARTVVDLAAVARTPAAVVMADHFVRTSGREALIVAWQRAQPFRGHRRAWDVIDFADGRAGSALESVSRVNMRAIGCPQPHLQIPFSDSDGLIGVVDFFWPELGIVGEADGDVKYLDPSFRGGRSADQVVLDEKIREDRLRALGLRVVRWRWRTAADVHALRSKLSSAGLPQDLREPWGVCRG